MASPVLNRNINKVIGIRYNQSQVICCPNATITIGRIASCGRKLINSLITADSGRRILGKLTVLRSPELEVIALAPEENEPEKNENRNTPVIKNGMKLSGLRSPRINPKTKP
jgi:hypothetical protein